MLTWGFEGANEVYPMLVILAGESGSPGWFAGDSVGNSGLATSSPHGTTEAVGQLPWSKSHFGFLEDKDMASIRTARVIAAVAALPLAVALFGGVASADNGSFANDGSNASVASIIGSGVGGNNNGNSSTSQQVATGSGASNQNNTAQVNGSAFTAIDQSNSTVAVNFYPWW